MAIAVDSYHISGLYENGCSMASGGTYTVTKTGGPAWIANDVGARFTMPGDGIDSTITSVVSANECTIAYYYNGGGLSNKNGEWFKGGVPASGSGSASLTWSHTCGASANYLVVAVEMRASSGLAGVTATYNSVSMTCLDYYHQSGGTGVALYGLANPATGSAYTVYVHDTTETLRSWAGMATSYCGVNTSSPVGTPAHGGQGGGGGTNPQLTVSSASGEVVVSCLGLSYKATVTTADSPTTMQSHLRILQNFGAVSGQVCFGSTPGQASTLVDFATNQTEYWGITGIALKPAADAGGTVSAVYNVTP